MEKRAKDFEYIVADPTGNITVLISSSYEDDEERAEMISSAFEMVEDCEQAGFISTVAPGHVRVEMMGYEFCGNASLSAASWQALKDGIGIDEQATILLDSSGIEDTLEVRVRRTEDVTQCDSYSVYPQFTGRVDMPVPEVESFRGYPVVHFGGISHIIAPSSDFSMSRAESCIREFAEELDVPALGIIICDTDPLESDTVEIRPLVYVRDTDTVVPEHGCATGSTAVGYYRCVAQNGTVEPSPCHIIQPGGVMKISIKNGRPELTGNVILYI